jgi:hypothetical protein
MIVVETSHAHVMKFLPLYSNITLMCHEHSVNCVNGVYSLIHIILIIFIWSGNHTFYYYVQGVIESCTDILTTSYWLHVELGKNI